MILFATYSSPLGPIEIGYDGECIVSIRCGHTAQSHNPSPVSDLADMQLQEYFAGKRKVFDLPISYNGTAFQRAVWEAISRIPYGEVRSYGQIATELGNPRACRAVGQAANRNPIWIVIPCHRVVGSNHELTGYAGGLDRKSALLELEKTQNNAPKH